MGIIFSVFKPHRPRLSCRYVASLHNLGFSHIALNWVQSIIRDFPYKARVRVA
jgi:hypothetical protein